jgi:DNA sulfur modification protein DndD
MRFSEIRISNVGPYYGDHVLTFGSERPLVIFHGENMRGKSNFLHAVRLAFYGKVRDRLGGLEPFKGLVNRDAAAENTWSMSVRISGDVTLPGRERQQFEVERWIQAKDQSVTPRNDTDFENILSLKLGQTRLSPDQSQRLLNEILPEQIARFFLFDGELLDDYEVLLTEGNDQTWRVKEAIEHILGLPLFANAQVDLRLNFDAVGKRLQQVAKRTKEEKFFSAEAQKYGRQLEILTDDLRGLQNQREQMVAQQKVLDGILLASSAQEVDVQALQEIRQEMKKAKEEEQKLSIEKSEKLASAWLDLVQEPVQERIAILEEEYGRLVAAAMMVGRYEEQLRNLTLFDQTRKCPTCDRMQLDAGDEGLLSRIAECRTRLDACEFDRARLEEVGESLRRLRRIKAAGVQDSISFIERRLMEIRVDIAELERRQKEVELRLRDHDSSQIARNRRDYQKIVGELVMIEQDILKKEREVLKTQEEGDRARQSLLKAAVGPESRHVRREYDLYDGLMKLFRDAIVSLRDERRLTVQRVASEIFRQLTTDKDYCGLEINDQYGLTIVDESGRPVARRSAGAEQVVALSLIGALNRCAVRQAPVIMDTPFGRLDRQHRSNVLRFMPTMAEQVMLLVHGGELDPDRDLAEVMKQVDREYRIERISINRSRFVVVRDE